MILNFLGEKKNVKNYDLPQEGFSGYYAQGKHETQVDCSQSCLAPSKILTSWRIEWSTQFSWAFGVNFSSSCFGSVLLWQPHYFMSAAALSLAILTLVMSEVAFRLIRSSCWFWFSSSPFMSLAMFLRFPIMALTWITDDERIVKYFTPRENEKKWKYIAPFPSLPPYLLTNLPTHLPREQAEKMKFFFLFHWLTCSMFSSISSSRASFVILPMKAPFGISTPGGGGAPPPPCCNAIETGRDIDYLVGSTWLW